MKDPFIEQKLENLFSGSAVRELGERDRVVVVSDLHMGDGSSHDDFRRTSRLFSDAFSGYYLEKGFKLVLNGDVEELHKFVLHKIREKWDLIYELFTRFQEDLSLHKLLGNHDQDLLLNGEHDLLRSLRMRFRGAELFFLHGHQASNYLERLHSVNRMMVRSFMNPLRIKTFALDLGRKRVTRKEYRLSSFSLRKGIMTFVGHTHRPLFGSDSGSPLLYNSGAAIGKKGITSLEIDRGRLNLVHWLDRNVVKRYIHDERFEPERLKRSDVYRVVLNSRKLTDIMGSWKLGQSRMQTMQV